MVFCVFYICIHGKLEVIVNLCGCLPSNHPYVCCGASLKCAGRSTAIVIVLSCPFFLLLSFGVYVHDLR